jgi:hypothetical protein
MTQIQIDQVRDLKKELEYLEKHLKTDINEWSGDDVETDRDGFLITE